MDALTSPYKDSVILVALKWYGASGWTWSRYTNGPGSVTYDLGDGGGSVAFSPTPTMVVELPKNTAGFSPPESLKLDLPAATITRRLSDGMPHAPVFVRVCELIRNDTSPGQDVLLTHYVGRLAVATRNPGGKSDRVALEFVNFKHTLQVAMGVPANHTCAWTFGDDSFSTGTAGGNCAVNVGPLLKTGTVTVISAKTVTITGVTTPSGTANDNYWRRGFVSSGHLLLQVREWSRTAPTTFELVRQPPASWLGSLVTLGPGCDKLKTTCSARWNNISRFAGFGDAIPSRNPTQELP